MIKGKWLIQKGLLTSGLDPSSVIAKAADFFGDEYTPMVFMTGDGHRNPPFKWTTRGVWCNFFKEIVQINGLCCHVEKYSDSVSKEDVPLGLRAVFNNNKVFGWEPDFYKKLQELMEKCFSFIAVEKISMSDISIITNTMRRIAGLGYLTQEAITALDYWEKAKETKKDPVPMKLLPGYQKFLGKYAGTRAMQLRTEIHKDVGATIQENIDRYAGDMHLITCGDAHITCSDPLYLHVKPPIGTFGVVDEVSK